MPSVSAPGFQDRADIRLGDTVFNTYDEFGVAWMITDLDGWWDLPDVAMVDDPRPFSQDGGYLAMGRYVSRNITMSGTIMPPIGTELNVVQARARLAEAVDLVRRTATLMVDEDPTKQAVVQLVGKPTFKNSKLNGAVDFQVPLRAPDPRKYASEVLIAKTGLPTPAGGRKYPRTYPMTYGEQRGTPGIATCTNAGSYDTGAVVQIQGPVQGPTVEHVQTGSVLSFHLTLNVNDYLEIDLVERTVLLNGDSNRRNTLVSGSRWFTLSPGDNGLRFNGVQSDRSADPSLSVAFRSAWIY